MKLTTIAALATAAVIAMAMPASAQMSSGNTMSNGSAMSNGMSNSNMSGSMTCQQMMDKAGSMAQPTDASKKQMAMDEMSKAKAAMASGKEKTCQMHMKKAMTDMM